MLNSRPVRPTVWPSAQVEILAYAPTEFYHCQHCEIVWGHLGLGDRLHAEERKTALPADLQAEYAAISDWALQAFDRYGNRLTVKVIDAASIEGLFKAVRHRTRRFPSFIIDGRERIVGFDRQRLDSLLADRLEERR
ncbi:MAG: hypothetical protein E6J01_04455 [Chloroflexi bacterium]|nr:MAG: hypothetical protein E6J01_04455 [Chloroflexota bacterium]